MTTQSRCSEHKPPDVREFCGSISRASNLAESRADGGARLSKDGEAASHSGRGSREVESSEGNQPWGLPPRLRVPGNIKGGQEPLPSRDTNSGPVIPIQ